MTRGRAPNIDTSHQPTRDDLLRRLLSMKNAEERLLPYTRFCMPDARDPSPNPRTRYITGPQHIILEQELLALERGDNRRLIVNIGPRHGKTELASKRFIPWYSARHPDKSLIFGTYNETYAADVGRAVGANIASPEHRLIFPHHGVTALNQSRVDIDGGGSLYFVGRGGSITGRGGHGIMIDDPIKDRKEADSKLIRDQLWEWFTQVVSTRQMTDDAWIALVQTRWHEDDLVGRLTDPRNPFYSPDEAAQWRVIDLPALALEDDILGRKPGEALWPERFPETFLRKQQQLDPRGFQALYQGRPSAAEGSFFRADWLRTYRPDELPKDLRYYVASDHAVSVAQGRDKTAMVPVGVDENDNIYVLPTVFWQQATADKAVDAMLNIMRQHRPVYWWAERGHITKAIGPFLRKRMMEENTYAALIELTPIADKQTRAQSIQGRIAMGKVFFPSFASWWPDARDQLLKFPQGAHDDFVDALAYIGLGLSLQVPAHVSRNFATAGAPGTFKRMFNDIKRDTAATKSAANQGW